MKLRRTSTPSYRFPLIFLVLLLPTFALHPAHGAWEAGYKLIDYGIALEDGQRELLIETDELGRPFSGEILWAVDGDCHIHTLPASSPQQESEWSVLHDSGLFDGHPAHALVKDVRAIAMVAGKKKTCALGGKDGEFVSLAPSENQSPKTHVSTVPLGGTVFLVRPSSFLWPKTLTVKAGTRVVWIYADGQKSQHTITSGACDGPTCRDSGKLFDSKLTLVKPGDRFEYTFTTPGSYPYHCDTHTAIMQGTITVLPR